MEIHILPISDGDHAGKFMIYRPVSGLAFVGNRAMADLCLGLAGKMPLPDSGVRQEVLDFLQAVGFFEEDILPADQNTTFQPSMAALLLTNQCQLRCTYCYAAAGENPRQEMSVEVGRAAIDHVHDIAQSMGWSSYEVAFHGGGEPTIAWDVIKACTEYARQKSIKPRITLTSNGIWNSKQADWILSNLDSVSVSMDGSIETQNRQRPTAGGRASAEQVMRTIAKLDQHGFPYAIRMTTLAPWDTLPEDVRFICENTQCRTMQAEPAFNAGRGRHGRPGDQDSVAFVNAFMQAFEVAAKAGRELRYSGSRLGVVTSAFCLAPYNALVASANGGLVACFEIASDTHALAQLSTIGKIENGQVRVDDIARNRLHTLIAEHRASCRDCYCYWSCAGDCYTRSFDANAGVWQHGVRCEINRLLMEKMLLRGIAEGGGVWRSTHRSSAPLSIAALTER